ncbi:LysR family transcriptional regulator [Planctomicrobium sp. SH661]|uniref:LysR family transcriptional regulator n=1 Tax=Planctomicrobium sp. SH661 TaxID=3448124 RepID=UPI003F5B600D
MSTGQPHPPIYKDLSYPQLRSYCEMARLGSMSAAARSLQVSHPTIWKQIRSLEQLLKTTLVDSDGRRSELTEAGRILAELATPVITEFESLQDRFHEECGTAPRTLSVAAPPRSYTDDLLPVIEEFRAMHPDVHLIMREVFRGQGNDMLESGEVDLVIGDRTVFPEPAELTIELLYEIEPMVIMPVGHPLSKRRKIEAEDLAKYPVLNRAESYADEEGRALLQRAGVFDHPQRGFDLVLAASIRACVKAGHGIGLVGRVRPEISEDPEICERSLKHFLRPLQCFGHSLRRIRENPTQRAFTDLLKSRLHHASPLQ